jgi:hypothetical protein
MNSNAAAIRRRAGNVAQPLQQQKPGTVPTQNAQQPASQTTQAQGTNGLTLPQVIAVVDKRLLVLETFMKETKEAIPVRQPMDVSRQQAQQPQLQTQTIPGFDEYVQEMDAKFQLLAEEITNLKDIVLKLQTYTLEVNKTLFDERQTTLSSNGENSDYKGLSDLSETNNFTISDPTTIVYA